MKIRELLDDVKNLVVPSKSVVKRFYFVRFDETT